MQNEWEITVALREITELLLDLVSSYAWDGGADDDRCPGCRCRADLARLALTEGLI